MTTTSLLDAVVVKRQDSLVLFYGEDCGSIVGECSSLFPTWDSVADTFDESVLVSKIDVEKDAKVTQVLGMELETYPQVIFFSASTQMMYVYRSLVNHDDETIETMNQWVSLIKHGAISYTGQTLPDMLQQQKQQNAANAGKCDKRVRVQSPPLLTITCAIVFITV